MMTVNEVSRLAALEKLQQILLFRKLQFPLKEVKKILDAPDFDRNRALEQQVAMLELKKEHLENLILFARGIQLIGVRTIDFTAFDTKELDEYAKEAKESWGKSPEFREFEEKKKSWTADAEKAAEEQMEELFAGFGRLRALPPSAPEVQGQVEKLRNYITEHFYTCSLKTLRGLGEMYAGDGRFTENIDAFAGAGTAHFVEEAVRVYCDTRER